MLVRSRLPLSTAAAIAVLGLAVGSSGAHNLFLSRPTFRIVWTPMSLRTLPRVECNVTMEGSFHSATFSKVVGALIGYITRAQVSVMAPCIGGEFWALNGNEVLEQRVVANTLPWHVQYNGFTGTLPAIAGIIVAVLGLAFLLMDALEERCLYQAMPEAPAIATISVNNMGMLARWKWREESRIPRAGGLFCMERAELVGGGTITQLGSTETIAVRLI